MKKITLLLLSLFFSIVGYAQFTPTVEGFENTTGPDPLPGTNWTLSTGNWTVFTLGTTDASTRWETITGAANVNSGTRAARSNRGNVGQNGTFKNFLVSPLVNMPSNAELHFWTRLFQAANQNTVFRIMIAPEGADLSSESSYTTVQQWTELDLLAGNFNIYAEKVVGLSGFAPSGADIHIAFVMEDTQENTAANSDRWLIDDVSVVAQCPAPTLASLQANNISQTTAELIWDNPSGATSWEIEIVPAAANPTGTGVVYNGILPYLATATQPAGVAFTPTTAYKYYVRAMCSGGPNSAWIGPKDFSTSSPGLSCTAPIQVPTPLLYTTTDTTANYADNNDVSQPAGCVAGNTNYMAGNEVYYSYTAPANGTISVTMTPNAANSSLFVYEGCANIAVACIGGVANDTADVRSLPNIPVVAGQQYIIVISSSAAMQTIGYTLVIQDVNCAQPATPTVSGITQTSANVSWPAGAATSWEVLWQPAGDPLPSGSGTQTNDNSDYPVTPLTANTSYDFYVRADCGNGTDFSAWTGPINIRTLCDAFPVPFQEGFNSTSTTEGCWTILDVNNDDETWNTNYNDNTFEGDEVAVMYTDFSNGANDDWLISPQIILTGNQRLKYRYRVQSAFEANDFRVMLSTNGTAIVDFTNELVAFASYDNVQYVEKVVNLPFSGPVNIAFHVPAGGLDGWRLYIDNFIVENIPTCPEPTALAPISVLSTSANIEWTNGGTETAWQITRVPCGDPAPTETTVGTDISSNPYNLTGLDPTTCYDIYVRAVCPGNDLSPWTGPLTITTQVAPPECDGFFTDPGGANGDYEGDTDSTVTICPQDANDLVTVTFTFFETEGNWDGLYVYDGDSVNAPQIASDNGPGFGDLDDPGAFWGFDIPGPFTSSSVDGCLTFRFISDASFQEAGWSGLVTCDPAPTCKKPNALETSNLTSSGVTLDWNQFPNPDASVATAWQILVLPCGSPAPAADATGFIDSVTNHPFDIPGLDPNTCYDIYVRAVCSSTDSSAWAGIEDVRTLCVPFPLPFQEGFNSDSVSEACWTVVNGNNDTEAWDMNYAFNPYEGNQVAVMYTDFNGGANDDWLISPQIEGLDGNQRLRYRYRVQSAFEPNDFRVMLSNNGTAITEFTTELVGLATYDNVEYIENIVMLTGITGPINIGFHVPQGGLDGWRLFIDKVIVETNPTCIEPTALEVLNTTATSAYLGWFDNNAPEATQWEVLILPAGSNEPLPTLPVGTGILVNSNPALITGLDPSTEYVFFVRAICSDTDHSAWSLGQNFSTKPGNDECADATFVPVNSSAVCNQIASGVVSGAGPSTGVPALTAPCVGNADDDVWFQFIATNSYLNVSLQNVQGSTQNLNYAIYSGTCGALTQFDCSEPNELSYTLNNLTVGDIYYIRVYSNSAQPQTVSFDLCISTPSTCATASTVCDITYGNTTGVDSLGTIGCLFSSPNPTFFTIQVLTTGPLNFTLEQTSQQGGVPDLDVDYAAWGPFTSQSVACGAINLPGGGFLAPGIGVPVTTTTGCSFLPDDIEFLNIVNAQAGEFYIILITNYSDDPGFISLTQTNAGQAGAGTTFCCNDAIFEYDQDEYCKNATTPNPVVSFPDNSIAGTFTSFPAGLVFVDAATGEVDLQASAPGYYQITNTLPTSTTCPNIPPYYYFIRITEPQSATITYLVTEACDNDTTTIPVTITGNQNGTFSVLPQGGLFIDADTGLITPSLSTAGTYTISYDLPDNGPCPNPAGSATIVIKATPIIVSPGNQIVCNSYQLPALSVGNYYTLANGGGTMLNADEFITSSQTVYIYANVDGCISEDSFTVTVNTVPTPTVDITQPTCAVQTGTIEVTSPLSTGAGLPSDLFISEVTDANTGSLTYIEIYNATGSAKTLSDYKLKVYTFGTNQNNPVTLNCDLALSGTLANNSTYVIKVSNNANIVGVTPDATFTSCSGVNNNDYIKLTTAADVDVDLWGRTDGTPYTPAFDPGYTYRRLATATVPRTTWDAADWTAIDPEDYTNLGSYTFATGSNYQYSLDNGTYQSSTTFSGVAPGNHTITVQDLSTGCFSTPLDVVINAIPLTAVDTDFTYTTPVCKNATTNPLPSPVNALTFTAGGTYSEDTTVSTGLVFVSTSTGEIDLTNSTAGQHTIKYEVLEDLSICQAASSDVFVITINPIITPVVGFSYASPVCENVVADLTPTYDAGFTAGGTFAVTPSTGLVISATGVISLNGASDAGTYDIVYSVNADANICQVSNTSTAVQVVINPIITPIVEFSYNPSTVCPDAAIQSPVLGTGFTTGGSFTNTTGLNVGLNTGDINVVNSPSGTYTIRYEVLENTATCQVGAFDTAQFIINSPIAVTATGGCEGASYILSADPVEGSFDPTAVTYSWEDSTGLVVGSTQTIVAPKAETYTVTVTSNGCSNTAFVVVETIACVIQKGISPNNGDDENNAFELTGLDVKKLEIFNRYGMKVYTKSNYTNQWVGQSDNGDELPDGTYYYVIERNNGENKTGWIYINREQ